MKGKINFNYILYNHCVLFKRKQKSIFDMWDENHGGKYNKKLFILILSLLLMVSLAGCKEPKLAELTVMK